MLTLVLSVVTCGTSLLSLWLIGNRKVAGFWIGAAQESLWLWLGLATHAYGLCALAVVYAVVYVRNARRWQREER